jgi:hypothetical protein
MVNYADAFGLQPFVNLTLQDSHVAALKYLHFHQQRSIGDLAVVKSEFVQESSMIFMTGERSGLQTHIAATESVSLCERMNC